MDYMDSRLLRSVKRRIFDELTDSLQQHANFRDKVKAYHKFPYKERPMMGIVLKNSSANRQRLAPDDYAAEVCSHVALASAKNKEGRILKWVWEDQNNLTKTVLNEDISSQLSGDTTFGTNRVFIVQYKPIVSGKFNTKIADNFAQVEVTVDGNKVFPEYVNGKKGIIILPQAPPVGSVVLISYERINLTPPGRYYIEVVSPTQFVIDPIYVVKTEELITRTTGTEVSAQTENHDLLENFDVLYTLKGTHSNKIYLVRGTDYTINAYGSITLLNPLPIGTTFYADYRWIGDELGPFDFPEVDFEYNNTALPGVILGFGSERIVGDKNVVIVYPQREKAAKVYSGHWNMTFDIEVVSRDPVQLPELTDFIINDMWSRKRLSLIMEGLTIESIDAGGEIEDVYDENTGDQYYKNSVPLTLISEWKKFVPYLTEIMDYDMNIYPSVKTVDYVVTKQGKILEMRIVPNTEPFEVKYPEIGYVRYY